MKLAETYHGDTEPDVCPAPSLPLAVNRLPKYPQAELTALMTAAYPTRMPWATPLLADASSMSTSWPFEDGMVLRCAAHTGDGMPVANWLHLYCSMVPIPTYSCCSSIVMPRLDNGRRDLMMPNKHRSVPPEAVLAE